MFMKRERYDTSHDIFSCLSPMHRSTLVAARLPLVSPVATLLLHSERRVTGGRPRACHWSTRTPRACVAMQPLTSSACALDGCAAKVVELSTVDRGVRTLGLVLGLIGLPVVVVGALYWLTSEPYWIYHERIYDSVRNEY